MRRLALGIALVAPFVFGCGSNPEGSGDAPPLAQVEFKGKIDSALAGTWSTETRDSILTLGKDGTLKIESTFPTPKGKQSATHEGSWLVDTDRLCLRYKENDGAETTIAYAIKASGNTMTLSTKVPKKETVYTRK